jgi:transcriptional regulator with XRE-family HTH domain
LEGFFADLKEFRIREGFTLNDLQKKTRINPTYLAAIESGDLTALPKGYDRIFMKAYLQAINADVEARLQEFDRLLGRREPTQIIDLEALEKTRQLESVSLLKQRSKLLFFWAPSLLIIALLVYLFVAFGQGDESATDSVPALQLEDYIADVDSVQTALVLPPQDSLIIDLEARKTTWMRVVIDRRDTLSFTLSKGETRRLFADTLSQFIIGVGDALVISWGDSIYRDIAPSDQVIRNLELTRRGLRKLEYAPPRRPTSN